MVIFVLWIKFDRCGINCNIVVDWIYNMDDGFVQANQQAGILSGMAIYNLVGFCVVFKQCGCIDELTEIIMVAKATIFYIFNIFVSGSPMFRYFKPNSST